MEKHEKLRHYITEFFSETEKANLSQMLHYMGEQCEKDKSLKKLTIGDLEDTLKELRDNGEIAFDENKSEYSLNKTCKEENEK